MLSRLCRAGSPVLRVLVSALTPVLLSVLAALQPARVQAAEQQTTHVLRIPPCRAAPAIDGTLAPGEWDGAFQGFGMFLTGHKGKGLLGHPKVWYWLTYDTERLYVAMRMELPPDGTLVGKRQRITSRVFSDDHIELWIDPARDKAQEDSSYYQFGGNFTDTLHGFVHNPRTPGWLTFQGDAAFRNTVAAGWWTTEFSVAAAELEKAEIRDGQTWGVNICRAWKNPAETSAWPDWVYWYDRTQYARLVLDRAAPVVRIEGLGNPGGGRPGFDLVLANPETAALELTVSMRVEDRSETPREVAEERTVTLAPGAREAVRWDAGWTPGNQVNLLSLAVTSADGQTVYFASTYPFNETNVPETAWKPPEPRKKEVEFKACFYPGFSRLRCLLDAGSVEHAELITHADVTVQSAAGETLAQGRIENLEGGEGETCLQLPSELAEGVYTATLTLKAGEKAVGEPLHQTFEKKVFPFEGSAVGVSDHVLKPWTEMRSQVSGVRFQEELPSAEALNEASKGTNGTPALSVWNRTYTLGPDGFPAQVKSGAFELLSRPMELVARSDGKVLAWQPAGVRIESAAPQAADFSAATDCSKVNVTVACHAEYDGMLKYTVTLAPAGDGELDGLDLVVSLKRIFAWLLHATSDGCRTNKSLFTPEGKGRVWDSLQVAQWRLTGSFIPYVWLGDDRVGLCWWADSERGWVRPASRKEPAIEVRREGDEVQLVLHMIGRPWQLKEPRTIVFALNATPVRPRTTWSRTATLYSTKEDGFLAGPHLWWYGFAGWTTFGKTDLPDLGLTYSYAHLRPISDEAEDWLREDLAKRRAQGYTVYAYTDLRSRAIDRDDEVRHYASEWARDNDAFTQEDLKDKRANWQFVANLTKSRIDYDMWCLKHDAELGLQGFLLDETQCTGQLNPCADLGFQDDEGNWEAECSLFAMREYLKRLNTMLQDLGHEEPIVIVHSTSTMYAGPYAFATSATDLEYSSPDRERGQFFGLGEGYSLCNVMAWRHGFHAMGQICPVGASVEAFWVGDTRPTRTWLGSALLFDVRPGGALDRPETRVLDAALGHFGYDQPDVQFVPYWRAGNLQRVGPDCVRASLYRRGRQALVVLYNDNPEPVTARWLPTEAFIAKGAPYNVQIMLPDQMLHDAKTLGFRYAYPQARDESGAWGVFVPAYDFRLLLVPATGEWGGPAEWGPVDPAFLDRNVESARE